MKMLHPIWTMPYGPRYHKKDKKHLLSICAAAIYNKVFAIYQIMLVEKR